jgi:hypothetical protein
MRIGGKYNVSWSSQVWLEAPFTPINKSVLKDRSCYNEYLLLWDLGMRNQQECSRFDRKELEDLEGASLALVDSGI